MSLFPSLPYFMTYFKRTITYLTFWVRWTSREQQLVCRWHWNNTSEFTVADHDSVVRKRIFRFLRGFFISTQCCGVVLNSVVVWFLTVLPIWEALNSNLRPFNFCCTDSFLLVVLWCLQANVSVVKERKATAMELYIHHNSLKYE
jgi:hypothetical protein